MNCHTKNTAVLYFTRSAEEEARAKTFCNSGNFAQNRAIAQKLIDHTLTQIQESGLQVRVFSSSTQQGDSFGEKLGNAFQSLFDAGYQNVIAVGNDCIHLSADTINYAANLLGENNLVAGPTADGGTYLLGINRKAFHKKAFYGLAWETARLLDDFIQYAKNSKNELTLLCQLSDIDNETGLRWFMRQAYNSDLYFRLVIILLSILSTSAYFCRKREIAFFSTHLHHGLYHRGPPAR